MAIQKGGVHQPVILAIVFPETEWNWKKMDREGVCIIIAPFDLQMKSVYVIA